MASADYDYDGQIAGEYRDKAVADATKDLRAELVKAVSLLRQISHYADGHELRGKWAYDLRNLKNEAAAFAEKHSH